MPKDTPPKDTPPQNTPVVRPTTEISSLNYDRECQSALAVRLDKLLDEAQSAGWDRGRAASAVMYLSAKRLNSSGS